MRKKAFSLLEIVVALILFSFLLLLSITKITRFFYLNSLKANSEKYLNQARQIALAVVSYKTEKGVFPQSLSDLEGKYLDVIDEKTKNTFSLLSNFTDFGDKEKYDFVIKVAPISKDICLTCEKLDPQKALCKEDVLYYLVFKDYKNKGESSTNLNTSIVGNEETEQSSYKSVHYILGFPISIDGMMFDDKNIYIYSLDTQKMYKIPKEDWNKILDNYNNTRKLTLNELSNYEVSTSYGQIAYVGSSDGYDYFIGQENGQVNLYYKSYTEDNFHKVSFPIYLEKPASYIVTWYSNSNFYVLYPVYGRVLILYIYDKEKNTIIKKELTYGYENLKYIPWYMFTDDKNLYILSFSSDAGKIFKYSLSDFSLEGNYTYPLTYWDTYIVNKKTLYSSYDYYLGKSELNGTSYEFKAYFESPYLWEIDYFYYDAETKRFYLFDLWSYSLEVITENNLSTEPINIASNSQTVLK